MGNKNKLDPQDIADQAQEDFDLGEYLDESEAPVLDKVRVFTSKKAGLKLGGAEEYLTEDPITRMRKVAVRTWGIVGQIYDLKAETDGETVNADRIAVLTEEARIAGEELEKSAIIFELKSVPPFVKKDAQRAAKRELGIHEKVTPSHARYEEYTEEHGAQILHRTTVSMEVAATGKKTKGISLVNARALKARIEEYEWDKLDAKMGELLWRKSIADDAVANADF